MKKIIISGLLLGSAAHNAVGMPTIKEDVERLLKTGLQQELQNLKTALEGDGSSLNIGLVGQLQALQAKIQDLTTPEGQKQGAKDAQSVRAIQELDFITNDAITDDKAVEINAIFAEWAARLASETDKIALLPLIQQIFGAGTGIEQLVTFFQERHSWDEVVACYENFKKIEFKHLLNAIGKDTINNDNAVENNKNCMINLVNNLVDYKSLNKYNGSDDSLKAGKTFYKAFNGTELKPLLLLNDGSIQLDFNVNTMLQLLALSYSSEASKFKRNAILKINLINGKEKIGKSDLSNQVTNKNCVTTAQNAIQFIIDKINAVGNDIKEDIAHDILLKIDECNEVLNFFNSNDTKSLMNWNTFGVDSIGIPYGFLYYGNSGALSIKASYDLNEFKKIDNTISYGKEFVEAIQSLITAWNAVRWNQGLRQSSILYGPISSDGGKKQYDYDGIQAVLQAASNSLIKDKLSNFITAITMLLQDINNKNFYKSWVIGGVKEGITGTVVNQHWLTKRSVEQSKITLNGYEYLVLNDTQANQKIGCQTGMVRSADGLLKHPETMQVVVPYFQETKTQSMFGVETSTQDFTLKFYASDDFESTGKLKEGAKEIDPTTGTKKVD